MVEEIPHRRATYKWERFTHLCVPHPQNNNSTHLLNADYLPGTISSTSEGLCFVSSIIISILQVRKVISEVKKLESI